MNKPSRKDLRIYLEAGHGGTDPGAIAVNGITEAALTLELRNGITAALRRMQYTGAILHDPDNANLAGALRVLKPDADDMVIGLHFNAGPPTATGTETIIQNAPYSNVELSMATAFSAAIANVLGIALRSGPRGPGVREWKETARGAKGVSSGWLSQLGHACIVEVCFISSASDLNKYQRNKKALWDALAQAIIRLVETNYSA